MSSFQQPAIANPEDKFVGAEHLGALLLFFPTELKQAIPTSFGTTDAVAAKVVNLNSGRILSDTLIFPTALVTQLKAAVPDGMVLGRLGQGEAKNGNSAPWLLAPHSEQDVAVAEAYLAANPRNTFNQPQAQQAPPTPAAPAPAWGGQPPAPAPAAQATGGWGNPQPQAQAAPTWAQAAPAPAQPSLPQIDPTLVEALRKKGVPATAYNDQPRAEQLWALVANNPDVTA